MTQNALVIGGSSGLGLEIAQLLTEDHKVFITGRQEPRASNLQFTHLELDSDSLGTDIDTVLADLPNITLLIYAAGFYQEGSISDLSDEDITRMERVGLLAPAMFLQRILKRQDELPGFIAITSTSQWTPRLLEPMYTATKAGLGMLANSVSLDKHVGKVLVAGPAGMNTQFWESTTRDDLNKMLDPKWVATEILKAWSDNFSYEFIRLLREPARVEVVETR